MSLPADPSTATYHDDVLHFTITYPTTLTASSVGTEIMDKAKAETNNDAQKKAMNCISTPLVAMRQTDDFAMLMIIRMDLECLRSTQHRIHPATVGAELAATWAVTSWPGDSRHAGPVQTLDAHDAGYIYAAL